MRKIAILVWCLLPIVALAYHLGPGQQKMILEDASDALHQAETYVASQQWDKAVVAFDLALSNLSKDKVDESRRIRLEKAKAQMFAAQLPAASTDLKALVDELVDESNESEAVADPDLLNEARAALA
ncbi:MAG: hypothetical protein KDB27_05880, partial [Planctomycetales bacterium]|nr:hypothetical protein [Planctomycetales bacterium]